MVTYKDKITIHCKTCNEDVEATLEEYAAPTYFDGANTGEAYYCPKCDTHIIDVGEYIEDVRDSEEEE
jgi:uncharacterized protein with PIN domain